MVINNYMHAGKSLGMRLALTSTCTYWSIHITDNVSAYIIYIIVNSLWPFFSGTIYYGGNANYP